MERNRWEGKKRKRKQMRMWYIELLHIHGKILKCEVISAIKRHGALVHATVQINPDNTILGDRRQMQKATVYDSMYMKVQNGQIESQKVEEWWPFTCTHCFFVNLNTCNKDISVSSGQSTRKRAGFHALPRRGSDWTRSKGLSSETTDNLLSPKMPKSFWDRWK